jgi:hypothetical protein
MHETPLRALIALGNSVLEESELELVFQRVIDAARELTGARYAALGVLDARGERLERFLTVGSTKTRARCSASRRAGTASWAS